jgi:MoxR-like ATPase
VGALLTEFDRGLAGVPVSEVRSRLERIERAIALIAKGRKLHGHLYDDLLALKSLHQRYTNYARWLKTQ